MYIIMFQEKTPFSFGDLFKGGVGGTLRQKCRTGTAGTKVVQNYPEGSMYLIVIYLGPKVPV